MIQLLPLQPIEALSSLIIPVLTSLISSPRWPPAARVFVVILLCAAVGFWESRTALVPGDWYQNAITLFGASFIAYKGLLKWVGLPALERGSADAWRNGLNYFKDRIANSGSESAEDAPAQALDVSDRLRSLNLLLSQNLITEEQLEARKAKILEAI